MKKLSDSSAYASCNLNINLFQAAAASMKIIDMCYTGHSTLLVPSRLWRISDNINEIIETMDIWLLTLEKRGCSGLLKAGASGLAEAFVLSLLASK